jgi:hypothetical protein
MTQPRQCSPGRAHLVTGIIEGRSTIILLAMPLSAKEAGEEATVYDIHTSLIAPRLQTVRPHMPMLRTSRCFLTWHAASRGSSFWPPRYSADLQEENKLQVVLHGILLHEPCDTDPYSRITPSFVLLSRTGTCSSAAAGTGDGGETGETNLVHHASREESVRGYLLPKAHSWTLGPNKAARKSTSTACRFAQCFHHMSMCLYGTAALLSYIYQPRFRIRCGVLMLLYLQRPP